MVIIRFDDSETEKRALDYLLGRCSFKTWANGDLMLGEDRLRALIATARGPEGLAHALDKALGTAWDAELEPYRYAGDGAPVTWLTQVG